MLQQKKRLVIAKPKQKATPMLLLSPFVLQPRKKKGLLQRYNRTKIEGDGSNDKVVAIAFHATTKKRKKTCGNKEGYSRARPKPK
jgi:hypothetical protein